MKVEDRNWRSIVQILVLNCMNGYQKFDHPSTAKKMSLRTPTHNEEHSFKPISKILENFEKIRTSYPDRLFEKKHTSTPSAKYILLGFINVGRH